MTEKQIEEIYEKIRWRIDEVNSEYLELVAKQIKKIGELNPSSIRKLEQMRIYGANSAKIKRELAKALKISKQEVENLLKKAAEKQYTRHNFDGVYRDRGAIPLEYNQELQRYIEAVARQTAGEILNFSNTTNIDEAYKEVVSDAMDAVSRGVTDYNSAIRSSMRKLGGDGLRVTYESGYTRRMDSAIRMNILDGVRQVAQKAAEINGELIGADGVELSAHPYSALDHEPAQGRMYTLAEFEKMQSGKDFQDTDGHKYKGFRRPIGQWNCHHIVSYVILGVSSRRYTDEQLEQWKKQNHKGIEIDGKEYTVYQASQLMRKLETEVRKQKDIANTAKNYGDDVLRREAQAKIRDLKKKYSEVAEAAGLRERPDKMVVESYRETAYEAQIANKASQSIAQARQDIKSGVYSTSINPEKQMRHLPGYAKTGKSIITIPQDELQDIVNNLAGTGKLKATQFGEWDGKEIIKADKIIGYTINKENAIIWTNRAKIHYSKTGVHVVPYSGR